MWITTELINSIAHARKATGHQKTGKHTSPLKPSTPSFPKVIIWAGRRKKDTSWQGRAWNKATSQVRHRYMRNISRWFRVSYRNPCWLGSCLLSRPLLNPCTGLLCLLWLNLWASKQRLSPLNLFLSQEYAFHHCCRWWMCSCSQLCSFLILSRPFPLMSTDYCSPLEGMTAEGFAQLSIRKSYWEFKPNICETKQWHFLPGICRCCLTALLQLHQSNLLV